MFLNEVSQSERVGFRVHALVCNECTFLQTLWFHVCVFAMVQLRSKQHVDLCHR